MGVSKAFWKIILNGLLLEREKGGMAMMILEMDWEHSTFNDST